MREIHRWPVDSPHKGPVTRKMFPFDDVIMTMLFQTNDRNSDLIIHWWPVDSLRKGPVKRKMFPSKKHRGSLTSSLQFIPIAVVDIDSISWIRWSRPINSISGYVQVAFLLQYLKTIGRLTAIKSGVTFSLRHNYRQVTIVRESKLDNLPHKRQVYCQEDSYRTDTKAIMFIWAITSINVEQHFIGFI